MSVCLSGFLYLMFYCSWRLKIDPWKNFFFMKGWLHKKSYVKNKSVTSLKNIDIGEKRPPPVHVACSDNLKQVIFMWKKIIFVLL